MIGLRNLFVVSLAKTLFTSTICVLSSEVVLEFCVNLLVFFDLFRKKKFHKCKLFQKHCANLPFYCAVVLISLYKIMPTLNLFQYLGTNLLNVKYCPFGVNVV